MIAHPNELVSSMINNHDKFSEVVNRNDLIYISTIRALLPIRIINIGK